MERCNFKCTLNPRLLTSEGSITQGSLIELSNAGTITSTDTKFDNCYTAPKGSIFKLNKCGSLKQTRGSFTNNAAIEGGAIYLEETDALFIKTKFENNWATTGGSIYSSKKQVLKLEDIQVISSRSTMNGGFLYATESLGL
jgi:hypothetical protein